MALLTKMMMERELLILHDCEYFVYSFCGYTRRPLAVREVTPL